MAGFYSAVDNHRLDSGAAPKFLLYLTKDATPLPGFEDPERLGRIVAPVPDHALVQAKHHRRLGRGSQENRDGASRSSDSLAPQAKHLLVFEGFFPVIPGGKITFTSSQPMTAIFLRGSKPAAEPAFLFQVNPVLENAVQ